MPNERKPLVYLLIGVLPFAALATSPATQEYDAALRCKPNLAQGQSLYQTCAACHGRDGAGASDGSVPALAAQHFRVLVRDLVDFRHEGRWDERMEHFTDSHHLRDPQDIADVADYLSRLPATRTQAHGSGAFLEQGRLAYARLCASCHGAAGQGEDGRGYPRLAAQHYPYLLEQLQAAGEDQRPDFSPEHARLLQSLQPQNLIALADYLSRLGA